MRNNVWRGGGGALVIFFASTPLLQLLQYCRRTFVLTELMKEA